MLMISRDKTSSSSLHPHLEWESLYLWSQLWCDSRQSKGHISQQHVAEPSARHVDAQLLLCLRNGLCHHHSTPADSLTHLLLFGWDVKSIHSPMFAYLNSFTVFMVIFFCSSVQQGSAVRMMSEALRERELAATELSLLIQELQALRHNLTMRGGTWERDTSPCTKIYLYGTRDVLKYSYIWFCRGFLPEKLTFVKIVTSHFDKWGYCQNW